MALAHLFSSHRRFSVADLKQEHYPKALSTFVSSSRLPLFKNFLKKIPMAKNAAIRMPEILMYGRTAIYWLLLAEIARISFLGSIEFGKYLNNTVSFYVINVIFVICISVVLIYLWKRQTLDLLLRMFFSFRLDLFFTAALGVWANFLLAPKLAKVHGAIARQDMAWAMLVLCMLVMVLLTSVIRDFFAKKQRSQSQLHFLIDDEIKKEEEDILGITQQAKIFAETVLATEAQAGLVFGIDAPWGTGKTSFLNIAEHEWDKSKSTVVVKFQTLRYASDSDLSSRFIRELCTAIKKHAFVPEFAPTADRYYRMLKGKTEVSFLGFKISLEPNDATIDDLLEDIDVVLKQSKMRLIVIIEDLDRLDPKLVNNVLFAVRRTFRLAQVAYILCYDAEMLVAGHEESARARDFIEKFITVKLSLFVDGEELKKFLLKDWMKEAARFPLIPADNMFKLSNVMNVVAEMVSGSYAHRYAPLLGDLRKLKRFANAMLMMQLDKLNLGQSDFDPRDLVHLVLLHLRYPGIFRKIYWEETESRSGIFSLQRGKDLQKSELCNANEFEDFVESLDETAKFLVTELFDIRALGFNTNNQPDESVQSSRACFNGNGRNLEKYLKLIVRFTAPADIETYALYKQAVEAVIAKKQTVREILNSEKFSLANGQLVQDKFWRVLVNKSAELQPAQANEAIEQLVDFLPKYSSIEKDVRGLRLRSVYSLASMLNSVGYGAPLPGRIRDSTNVREIGERILGGASKFSPSLIEKLAARERGALGWVDLMYFRVMCNIQRGGSLSNIYRGLLQFEDQGASGAGDVSRLSRDSLRRMSQKIFKLFKETYICTNINFYLDVDAVPDGAICGEAGNTMASNQSRGTFETVRASIKMSVIYQLANYKDFKGAGVGCGVYDETGRSDKGGIRAAMTRYLLDFCFDPTVELKHAIVFGDFCVNCVIESAIQNFDEVAARQVEAVFTEIFLKEDLTDFWIKHGSTLKNYLLKLDREIFLRNNIFSYKEKLPVAFLTLDSMAKTN